MAVGKGIGHGIKYGLSAGPAALAALAVIITVAGILSGDFDLSDSLWMILAIIVLGAVASVIIGAVLGGFVGGVLSLLELESKAKWIGAVCAGALPASYMSVGDPRQTPFFWIFTAVLSTTFAAIGFIAGSRFHTSITRSTTETIGGAAL